MKKIFYVVIFWIIFSTTNAFAVVDAKPFVFAKDAEWVSKGIPDDEVTIAFAKGDECFVLIQRGGDGFQDGVLIKTTEKPKNLKTKSVIQWDFFYKNVMGKPLYSYSYWGENYDQEIGPEIFSKYCKKYLKELPLATQEELKKYGAIK